MILERERQLVVEYGKKVSQSGLTEGTSGNLSMANRHEGFFAISPSGMDYFDILPEDVVVLKIDDASVVDGNRKPSSEWALHQAVYKAKPLASGVIHTHSRFCSTLACMQEPLVAVHYAIASCGAARVECAEYATFGTKELSENAIRAMSVANAALLANHGVIVCGQGLKEAFSLLGNLEYVAEIQWRAACAGGATVIDDIEMANILERFKTYGQPKNSTGG
ncbi:MAG TPA: class II aldolase/adducin family protein [Anaerolineaceae bacterium]|nr:class II aldolase/adducin family protein [Anaerolineaceae bacterium]